MKKFALSVFYILLAVVSQAQQYAVYATPQGQIKPLPNGQQVLIPAQAGGVSGQVQFNNSGVLGGFTFSGDGTLVPSTGIFTISNQAVTNAKLAVMPSFTFKANNALSAGPPLDLTPSQVKSVLAINTGDISGLGSMAVQNSGAVSISGGTIAGVGISGGTISSAGISGGTSSGLAITGGTISGANISSGNISGAALTGVSLSTSSWSGGTITGLSNPSVGSDAANKSYVDSVAVGIVQRTGVQVASTANLTLSGEQTIDGVLTSASRILVKNQSTTSQNGIYVTGAGAWSRASDSNTAAQLKVGYYYFVSSGTTQSATGWTIQTAPTVLGTDPVVFGQFSASTTYTNGTGIGLAGNVFSNTGVLSVAGTSNEINASGSTGSVTFSLPTALTFTGKTVTGGTFNSGAFNGSLGSGTPSTLAATTGSFSGQITSTVSTGTAPFVVSSTTQVANLNAATAGSATNSTNSTNSAITNDTTTNAAMFPVWVTANSGNLPAKVSSTKLTFNPSTGVLSAPTFGAGTITWDTNANLRTTKTNAHIVINVRDYGAVGDGVTDDTAAINSALAAAVNGSIIYFPQAQVRYNVTGLSFPASKTNLLIYGEQAQIYQTVNANNMFIVPNTCSYITFDGLWLNGIGSSRANGIHIRTAADYTTVRNCRIEGSSDWGIQVDNSGGAAVKGFVCESNYFINTLGDGVHVMNVDGFRIENNTLWQTGDDSIAAIAQSTTVQPTNGVISGNYIYGRTTALAGTNTHGNRGIAVFIGKNIVIANNYVNNTYSTGIEISDEYNSSLYNKSISVVGNTVIGANNNIGALGSIIFYFAQYCTCSDNTVQSPVSGSGIAFADCYDLTVTNNHVTQSINQFFRAVVNNGASSYTGRTITTSSDIFISKNVFNLPLSSQNECLYLVFTATAGCNNLIAAGNDCHLYNTNNFFTGDYLNTGKIYNNTSIGGTITPSTGAHSTFVTSGNNN